MLDHPRRALIAALPALLAACAQAPDGPSFMGAVAWDHPDERHGGLSGVEIGARGREVTAITDRSVLVTGRIARRGGVPVAIEDTRHHAMTTPEGGELRGYASDSEGLAVDEAGVAVGFEGYHRVWRFDREGRGTERLPLLDALSRLPGNSGPEAVAIDPAGGVLAIPERPAGDAFPVWRWDGEWREVARLRRRGPMKAVGADVGPDGLLYLLERRLTPLGFRSRVRRFALDGTGEETLLETPPGRHGNLEGLAVWRDGGGVLRLTMVSDDNFLPFQRGEIVEYRLDPPAAVAGRLDRAAPGG